MTAISRAPLLALVCAMALVAGCSGDEQPSSDPIAYSAQPSEPPSDGPPSPEGLPKQVAMAEQTCYSSGTQSLVGVYPAGWQVDPNGIGRCSWAGPHGGTLEFVYVSDVDSDKAWEDAVQVNQREGIDPDEYPGYSFVRLAGPAEPDGPLWHFQYLDDSTYLDSFNLYRGHWRITYESPSSEFNSYLAGELTDRLDVA